MNFSMLVRADEDRATLSSARRSLTTVGKRCASATVLRSKPSIAVHDLRAEDSLALRFRTNLRINSQTNRGLR
jgi:hypothetical protein